MSKRVSLFLTILFCFFLGQISLASNSTCVNSGYISVNSSMTKDLEPNIAEITFAVETQNNVLDIAVNENKKLANQILNAVKAKLDTKNGDTIKTGSYNVRPNYTYTKDNKQKLSGYTVVNSVKIKTKNTSNLGPLIDLVISQGANRLDNLSFGIENQQSVCNEMYPLVVKDVYTQASIIAKSLNGTVSTLKSLSASCNIEYSNTMRYGAVYAKSLSDSAESTPIEPGKIKVISSVNADFNIQQ